MNKVKSEDIPEYGSDPFAHLTDDQIIEKAVQILDNRLRRPWEKLSNSNAAKLFLRTKLQDAKHEKFVCLMLDSKNRLIEYKELFRGTIDVTLISTREVVVEALASNAAAVILAHNHPSGDPTPSNADLEITARLKSALDLVGVRLLDHIIIGGDDQLSFAGKRLL